MPKVRFTKLVDTTFHGTYRTPNYVVKAGDVKNLNPQEIERLNKDHPGLIEGVGAGTPDTAEGEPARTRPSARKRKRAPRGRDRMLRGGRNK